MDKFVPVRDAAKKMACSEETIRRQLRNGQIHGVKIGRDWKVPCAVSLSLSSARKAP